MKILCARAPDARTDPELRRAMAFEDDYILLGNKTQVVSGLGNAVTPPTATWKLEDLDNTASVSCAGAASEFDCRAGYEVSTSGPN